MKKRILRVTGILSGIVITGLLLLFFVKPPCLILRFTGFTCAGCGGQRMILSLLEGDIFGAFHHNPFLFALVPLLLGYGSWEAVRYIKQKRPLYQSRRFFRILLGVLLSAVVFTVLRNLPGVTFLGP